MGGWIMAMYLLAGLVNLVVRLLPKLAEGLLALGEGYVRLTLFLVYRGLDWLDEMAPHLDLFDAWYRRALAAGLLIPAAVWTLCRIIGLPTSWLFMGFLAAHGSLWGALATEGHTRLEMDRGADNFPLNL